MLANRVTFITVRNGMSVLSTSQVNTVASMSRGKRCLRRGQPYKKSQRRRIAIGCGEVPLKGYAQGIKRQRSGGQQAAPQQNHKRRRNQDFMATKVSSSSDLLLCEQPLAAHRYRFYQLMKLVPPWLREGPDSPPVYNLATVARRS